MNTKVRENNKHIECKNKQTRFAIDLSVIDTLDKYCPNKPESEFFCERNEKKFGDYALDCSICKNCGEEKWKHLTWKPQLLLKK